MSAKKEARSLLTASLSLNKPAALWAATNFSGTRWPRAPHQVGPTGVEPARPCGHKALNLARLPIPPRALGVPAAPGDSRLAQPDSVVYLAPRERQPGEFLAHSQRGAPAWEAERVTVIIVWDEVGRCSAMRLCPLLVAGKSSSNLYSPRKNPFHFPSRSKFACQRARTPVVINVLESNSAST